MIMSYYFSLTKILIHFAYQSQFSPPSSPPNSPLQSTCSLSTTSQFLLRKCQESHGDQQSKAHQVAAEPSYLPCTNTGLAIQHREWAPQSQLKCKVQVLIPLIGVKQTGKATQLFHT